MYKKHVIFLLNALQSRHVVQKKNRIRSEYDISLIIESFAERSTYTKVKNLYYPIVDKKLSPLQFLLNSYLLYRLLMIKLPQFNCYSY